MDLTWFQMSPPGDTTPTKSPDGSSSAYFKTPGQHVYKGVPFPGAIKPEVVHWVETSLNLRDDDIILATYPKTGKYNKVRPGFEPRISVWKQVLS